MSEYGDDMEHSYNGWPASRDRSEIGVKDFIVRGVSFPAGVKSGDVATILRYVVEQFDERVEPLMRQPGCWGYNYRQNRNAHNLSCHSSGTAVDVNAPKHPNGVSAWRTFTSKQIEEIGRIQGSIEELTEVVRWGGDFHGTPDSMHWEIETSDRDKVARVARRIEHKERPMNSVEQGNEQVKIMLAAGRKALGHYDAANEKRRAVKTFATALRYSLRLIRNRFEKVPAK